MITPGATSLRGQLDQATDPSQLRDAITAAYRTSEPLAVEQLLAGSVALRRHAERTRALARRLAGA